MGCQTWYWNIVKPGYYPKDFEPVLLWFPTHLENEEYAVSWLEIQ